MLDYKDIVTKHFALGMSGSKIAEYLKVSKSGVNDFLRAFGKCEKISFPLPEGFQRVPGCPLLQAFLPGYPP